MYGDLNGKGLTYLDKISLHYARCVLQVKSTTCNTINYGECGQFPTNVYCQNNALCLWNRMANTPANNFVKQVDDELKRLGIKVSKPKACGLARSYKVDPTTIVCVAQQQFKRHCKQLVMLKACWCMARRTWTEQTYIANIFCIQKRFCYFIPFEFSKEISGSNHKLRTSWHVLEIEHLNFCMISGCAEFVMLSKMRSIFWQAVIWIMKSEVLCIKKWRIKLPILIHWVATKKLYLNHRQ